MSTRRRAKAPELTIRLQKHPREMAVVFEQGSSYWAVWFYTTPTAALAYTDRRLQIFTSGVAPKV